MAQQFDQPIVGGLLPPDWRFEQTDEDGDMQYYGVSPSGERVKLKVSEDPDTGVYSAGIADEDRVAAMSNVGGYIPKYGELWRSGDVIPQEALDYAMKTFALPNLWLEQTPRTLDELVNDSRSSIRKEGDKYVFRPELSTGNWKYHTDRISNPLKGFLTDNPGGMMALAPITMGALGQMGVVGNVAGTMGAAEFPTFLGDVAAQGVGGATGAAGAATGAGVDFASSFSPTITEGTVAGATGGGAVSPLSSLETMAGSLGSGGTVATTGVGGAIEGALSGAGAAGGAGAGAGALEFLNTTPVDFGSTVTNVGNTVGSGEINFLDTLSNTPSLPSGGVNPVNVDLMNPNWTIDDLINAASTGGQTITSGLGPTLEGLGSVAGGAATGAIPWIQDLLGTTTGGAAGGLSLLDAVRKLFGGDQSGSGSGSGSGGGINWPGVGTSAIQMLMSKYLADKYDTLARDLSDRADPFGSTNVKGLRADAQNEYKTQYSGGPLGWMESTYKPFAETNMDMALRRMAVDKGMSPSLNPGALADVVKYTTTTGYNDYLKGRSQVAGEAGANVNPDTAANLYGQQAANSINQIGNMGGALGSGISYATGGTGNKGTDNTVNFIKALSGLVTPP